MVPLLSVQSKPWNANIHYHRLLLQAIPAGAKRVIDVGCGDGILCSQLVERGVSYVVGFDADAAVLDRAAKRFSRLPINWVHGDLLNSDSLAGSPYDAAFSVATLHHMGVATGLRRLAELVRPGGVVGVIGLASNDWWDLPVAAFGQSMRYASGMVRGYWEHTAPMVWPPPETYREMKQIGGSILPGVCYRRHLYNRYSLVWTKPETT